MDADHGVSIGQVEMSKVPRTIRILAVDDPALLRKGIAAVIHVEDANGWKSRTDV
jgi:hypothetical protein